MDKPRILLFAPLCYPPAGSEAIVTSKLVLAMLDAGWDVDVITQGDFGHFYPYSRKTLWEPVRRVCHSIDGAPGWPSLLIGGRAGSVLWGRRASVCAQKLAREKDYDVMMSRVTPLYGHLPALMIARHLKIPWITNWSDPLPPVKAPPPYGKGPKAPLPFLIEWYCRAICRQASWHTFPCDRLLSYVNRYLPGINRRSSVVPHIAFSRSRTVPVSKAPGFTLCHVGSLANRDVTAFLEGLRIFIEAGSDNRKDVRIRFIGNRHDSLMETAERLGLNGWVSAEAPRNYEETQKIMAESSACLLIEADGENVFFPSKFVDYVQTGRPVLALTPKGSTVSEVLATSGGGLAVAAGSPIQIARALQRFYTAWKDGLLDCQFDSHSLISLYDEKKVLSDYISIISKLQRIQAA